MHDWQINTVRFYTKDTAIISLITKGINYLGYKVKIQCRLMVYFNGCAAILPPEPAKGLQQLQRILEVFSIALFSDDRYFIVRQIFDGKFCTELSIDQIGYIYIGGMFKFYDRYTVCN